MTKQPRFIVQATCTIKGTYLDGVVANLWYGKDKAAAERVLARKREELGAFYRDWQVVQSPTITQPGE